MEIPFLKKIPGFRSGNILKAVVATIFYLFVTFVSLIVLGPSYSSEPSDTKTNRVTSLSEETNVPTTQIVSEFPTPVTPTLEKYKVLSVTDGDTLRIEYDGVSTPLRLIGIDTPETNHPSEPVQCYGPEASNKTREVLLGKYVELEKDVTNIDKYGRLLRYTWLDGVLVNELLVRQGYAISSRYNPDTKYQERLDAAQTAAENEKLGFWSPSTCNGDFYTGTYLDPNKTLEPVYVAPTTASPTTTSSGSYNCSCRKTCKQMSSCEEAYYQLQSCGCSARDGDKDGIPCESICN